ncbi:Bug family tripartite tricarboxylate transporter substrate binding protein [Ramlibacter albus]|uniref:Tripartite tricarboxylate transporter substrate binding protein n=1 Tax=Ramlibacter albus TaxID=2079448 RepID=A0A923M902_9BURK|nr:tripartite tricarboxylate transporter substrate binding protein [Ramlibacter albus]MBC5764979.1 tripartite tricarboxylate transporter substrate binding protein [Ramlibacter albus]
MQLRHPRRHVLAAALAPLLARAQAPAARWPLKPIRIIVVYPTGGLSDVVSRTLATSLSDKLGVPVFVDNRPGDGGALGMQLLARAQPDGYTLAFSAVTPLTLKPHIQDVGYDAVNGFAPLAAVMYTPVLLVGTPAFTGRSFADLVALARAKPGQLRWATSGVATSGHLVLEEVRQALRVNITHVPYKGGGQQIVDALSGQFELLSTNLAADQVEHVRAGKLRALAVGAPTRLKVLPNTPTFSEVGVPRANVASLFGLFATGGTPPEVVATINAAVQEALAAPELQARLRSADNIPGRGTADDFAREIARQREDNRRLAPVLRR